MNANAALVLSILPDVVALAKAGYSDNQIITKVVRLAERVITLKGGGKQRYEFAITVLKAVRPTLVGTSEALDKVSRKITIIVALLKDRDINDTGWDDELARKLESAIVWVDGLGSWFKRLAEKFPEENSEKSWEIGE